METGIDLRFISRVYPASVIVWAIGVAVSWRLGGFAAAAGWTAGSALSMGVLWGFEWIARRSFAPGSPNAQRDFVRFCAVKLPIILLALVAVVLVGGRSFAAVAAFCAGVVLTQTVIVLKVLGLIVVKRLGN